MRWRHTGTAEDRARAVRFAWTVSFLATLALMTILTLARSAQAFSPTAPPAFPAPPAALRFEADEEEAEGEEEESEAEECESEGEEGEGEVTEAEAKGVCEEAREAPQQGDGSGASGQCVIRSAHAHTVVQGNRVKLTVGYTTTTPVAAGFQLLKGRARFASFKRHLGRSGVLRFAKKLPEAHGPLSVHIQLPPAQMTGCLSRRLVLFPN
jgi:hypothetical protein